MMKKKMVTVVITIRLLIMTKIMMKALSGLIEEAFTSGG